MRRTASIADLGVRPFGPAGRDRGRVKAMPSPIRRSAARARTRSPPSQSSSTALVHVPIGRSVSSGCSAWPSQVPLSASLTGPAGTASRTVLPITLAGSSSCSRLVIWSTASRAAGGRRLVVMAAQYPSRPMSDLVLSEDRGAGAPHRPQPSRQAQRVPRRAGARHRRRAARRRGRPGRALRRAARRRPDVLLGHGPRLAQRRSRRRPSTCARSAAPASRPGTSPRRCPSRSSARSRAPASAARSSSRSHATSACWPPTRSSGMPETRIGLIPDVGGCSRLPQIVGLGRAKELIMTGKLIGAEEAERIGLANRVAPAGRARRRGASSSPTSCSRARRSRSRSPSG